MHIALIQYNEARAKAAQVQARAIADDIAVLMYLRACASHLAADTLSLSLLQPHPGLLQPVLDHVPAWQREAAALHRAIERAMAEHEECKSRAISKEEALETLMRAEAYIAELRCQGF